MVERETPRVRVGGRKGGGGAQGGGGQGGDRGRFLGSGLAREKARSAACRAVLRENIHIYNEHI